MKQFGRVLGVCLAFGLIAACGCSDTEADKYTAAAYISVRPPRTEVISRSSRNIAPELDMLKQSQANVATTESVLTKAIEEDVDEEGKKRDRIRNSSWFQGDTPKTVKLLQNKLSVVPVKDTNLIRISLSGPDRKEIPQVVNAVADALVHAGNQQVRQHWVKQMEKLNTRLEELNDQVAARQKTIAQVRGQYDLAAMRQRRTSTQATLQMLTAELTRLRGVKTQAAAALETMKEQQETGALAKSPEVMQALEQDPTYRSLVIARKNIEIELDALKRRLGSHRRTKATQDRLEIIEKKRAGIEKELVAKLVKAMMQKQESQVDSVSERILAVGNQYNEYSGMLRDLNASLAKVAPIESEIERLQGRAHIIKSAILQFRIADRIMPLSIHAYAEIPVKPTR